jgi:hypothetical protein
MTKDQIRRMIASLEAQYAAAPEHEAEAHEPACVEPSADATCSFCGHKRGDRTMLRSADGARVCEECVMLMVTIVHREAKKRIQRLEAQIRK